MSIKIQLPNINAPEYKEIEYKIIKELNELIQNILEKMYNLNKMITVKIKHINLGTIVPDIKLYSNEPINKPPSFLINIKYDGQEMGISIELEINIIYDLNMLCGWRQEDTFMNDFIDEVNINMRIDNLVYDGLLNISADIGEIVCKKLIDLINISKENEKNTDLLINIMGSSIKNIEIMTNYDNYWIMPYIKKFVINKFNKIRELKLHI